MSIKWKLYNENSKGERILENVWRHDACWGGTQSGINNSLSKTDPSGIYTEIESLGAGPYCEYILGLPRMQHVEVDGELGSTNHFFVPFVKQTNAAWLNTMQLLRAPQSYPKVPLMFSKFLEAGLHPDRAFCLAFVFSESRVRPAYGDDTPVAGALMTWGDIKSWEEKLRDLLISEVKTFSDNSVGRRKYDWTKGYMFVSGLVSSRTCIPCSLKEQGSKFRQGSYRYLSLALGDTWNLPNNPSWFEYCQENGVSQYFANKFGKREDYFSLSELQEIAEETNKMVKAA